MGNLLIVLSYLVGILTLMFSLLYFFINTTKKLEIYIDRSDDLFKDIKMGFYITLIILLISWFVGITSQFSKDVNILSNTLKNFGLIWFSFACLCAVGLLKNVIIPSGKKSEIYTTARKNLRIILKFTGVWSIILIILSWLFAY